MFQLYSNYITRSVCIKQTISLPCFRQFHIEVAKNIGRRVSINAGRSKSLPRVKSKQLISSKAKPNQFSSKRSITPPKSFLQTNGRSIPRITQDTHKDKYRPSTSKSTARTDKPLSKEYSQPTKSSGQKSVKGPRKVGPRTSFSKPVSRTSKSRPNNASQPNRHNTTASQTSTTPQKVAKDTRRNGYGVSFAQLAKDLPQKHSVENQASLVKAFNPVKEVSEVEQAYLESVFRKPATFIQSATKINQLQNIELPEVAFIGRSNVGKSSLINALVNRNKLVKTSSKPGHTKLLNLFKVSDRLVLTDMPGYGHGCRNDWRFMIWNYFKNRNLLRRVFLLVNCEHSLKGSDKELIGVLEKLSVPYQVC
ncbi:hypothetical protein K7432_009700 [Basidiobolus ranarum]|uniref:EngB-type G domain-containing protein n=1 Tax=Basidiobolus ranarum TaxID=34480 RepID=A0ABR2VWM4_9FUNG